MAYLHSTISSWFHQAWTIQDGLMHSMTLQPRWLQLARGWMSLSLSSYFISQGLPSPKNLHPRGSWPRPSCKALKTAREQKQKPQGPSWPRPRTCTTSHPRHLICPNTSYGWSRFSGVGGWGDYIGNVFREAFTRCLSQIPNSKSYTCLRRAYGPLTWLGWKVFKGEIWGA